MPTFRADYHLKTSLVLPQEISSSLMAFDGIEITLLNGGTDEEGHVSHLIARVVGDAPSLREAESALRPFLADGLDSLGFITRQKFEISKCVAVMEWDAFKAKRHILAMEQFDPHYPPLPNLHSNLVKSAERVAGYAAESDSIRLPLKYFRLGLIARQPEEQFQYFWLSFETLAEATKSKDKVEIECQICNAGLECKSCGKPQTRRPVASDEMRALLEKMGVDGKEELKRISKIRNYILHGRARDRMTGRERLDVSSEVDDMATIAWNGIVLSLPATEPLEVVNVDNSVVSYRKIISVELLFDHSGAAAHPEEAHIPRPAVSLKTTIRPIAEKPNQGTEK